MHNQTLWDPLRYEFLTCSTPITGPTGFMLTWVQCRAVPCLWTSIGQKPAGQWQMLQCSVDPKPLKPLVKGKVLKGKKAAPAC
jgi:hypothetical protein